MASFDVITLTKGPVTAAERTYAEEKLLALEKVAPAAISKIRLKLTRLEASHITTPAIAQVNIDVSDGSFVRVRVEAGTVQEASDLMIDRASRRLRRISDKYEARRHRDDGSWHQGEPPSHQSTFFQRDAEDRQLVRSKSIGTQESTIDEAAFDMSQLDYDFFVFKDVETGSGAFLYHVDDGETLRLRFADGKPEADPKYAVTISGIDEAPAPTLAVDAALKTLDDGSVHHVFFIDADTGEPSVAYLRYDGHYGLLTARD